jgi:hypothetical protein
MSCQMPLSWSRHCFDPRDPDLLKTTVVRAETLASAKQDLEEKIAHLQQQRDATQASETGKVRVLGQTRLATAWMFTCPELHAC